MMDLIDESHELRSYLEVIERSAKKASDLTERLLTFSKDMGKEESLVNCNTLLREVVKLLERTIDKRIVIELNLEKNLRAVNGAAGQLEQAFLNVCLNARDAMPDGGKLLISSENVVIDETYPRLSWNMKRGSYIKASISDTGIGMDAGTKQKIFEPFYTTKKRGEGTGLGLNMVYGIVDKHGGFINVYSEVGRGTSFNVYLPAGEEIAPEELETVEREDIPLGDGELILVIDDEPVVRDLGRDMLEKLGYRTFTAADADEGLKLFNEHRNDIEMVILDIIMPGASGQDVLGRIRETDRDVLVLLSSGYNKSFIGEEFLDDARLGFIQKPYSMEDLARKVRKLLDRNHERQ
jgi:two-component system cell cycle sensor histidine kinase/response regulator CckA